MERIKTYSEFWPFYLNEHRNRTNLKLHFIGTTIGFLCLVTALVTQLWHWVLVGLVAGYAFAWIGHFVFEKNKPATFKYPLWSFISDWRLWFNTLQLLFTKSSN